MNVKNNRLHTVITNGDELKSLLSHAEGMIEMIEDKVKTPRLVDGIISNGSIISVYSHGTGIPIKTFRIPDDCVILETPYEPILKRDKYCKPSE